MLRLARHELRDKWRAWASCFVIIAVVSVLVSLMVTALWSTRALEQHPLTGALRKNADDMENATGYLLGLSGIASIAVVAVVSAMVTASQRRAHALWRLGGATPSQVWRTVLTQCLLVAVPASLAGALMSLPLAGSFNRYLADTSDVPHRLFPAHTGVVPIGGTIALMIVVALVSAFIPAIRAARVSPTATAAPVDEPARMNWMRWTVLAAMGVPILPIAIITLVALLTAPFHHGSAPMFADPSDDEGLIPVYAFTLLCALALAAIFTVLAPVVVPRTVRVWTRLVPDWSLPWHLARGAATARLTGSTGIVTPLMLGLTALGAFFGFSHTAGAFARHISQGGGIDDAEGYFLIIPGAFVALGGTVAVLMILARQRATDIAVLRSAGITTRDLVSSLILESVIYTVTAAVLAAVPVLLMTLANFFVTTTSGFSASVVRPDLINAAAFLAAGLAATILTTVTAGLLTLRRPIRDFLAAE